MRESSLPVTWSRLFGAGFLAAMALGASAVGASPGIDLAGMNRAVAPGDDFNAFANGTWVEKTQIPADRSRWGNRLQLVESVNQRLIALAANAAKHPTSPVEETVGAYCTAFLDEAGIERKGLEPLQATLRKIAALSDRRGLSRLLGTTLRADVDALNNTNFYTENLMGLWVVQGLDDPQHHKPYLLQGGLGLPDRAYYLDANPKMEELRSKYQTHIATVLRLAGIDDATARAERIYSLERRIAESHGDRESSHDVRKANNRWRREEFRGKAPGIDWDEFFDGAGLTQASEFIVWQPSAVIGEARLVGIAPLADWKDYLAFHTLNHFSPVLPKAFADANFAFYGTALSGTPQPTPRTERAIDAANRDIGDLVGQLYVAKYFPPENKIRIKQMVANIAAAFERRIGQLDWMAAATKEQARAKLKTLYVGIGYPDTWTDYSGLKIDPADALGNWMRAEEHNYQLALRKLQRRVDQTEWCTVVQIVNAFNMPVQNALNFPAGILQPPNFDPAAPDAVNYGSIGSVIGHEISHSFDNLGSEFDAEGRLRNWWTEDDLKRFRASSAALVAQYAAYRPLPDLAVNGVLTLGENIADLAGLAAAFDAYRAARGDRQVTTGGAYTDDQLFFLAYAQSRRTKTREATLRRLLLTDGHAPPDYRTLTVRNLDAWYEAFSVKPGQRLYLAPEARVRVW